MTAWFPAFVSCSASANRLKPPGLPAAPHRDDPCLHVLDEGVGLLELEERLPDVARRRWRASARERLRVLGLDLQGGTRPTDRAPIRHPLDLDRVGNPV